VPDTVTYEEARQLEGRLIDAVMDYDTAHGTFTLCIALQRHFNALTKLPM